MASSGERKIAAILNQGGVNYITEYSFPDLVASSGKPLRFDFMVFDDANQIMFAIEYQGEQHYKAVDHFNGSKGLARQKYNDRQKVKYCLSHNIPLVIIPYYDYDILNLDYIFTKANFF